MNTDINVKNGKLIIEQINFKRILTRKVIANDPEKRQGKISLPKDLIDKEVYVIVPSKSQDGG